MNDTKSYDPLDDKTPRKTLSLKPAEAESGARIAKVMARAGLCSRRDAEGWIEAGRVQVNGTILTSPALNVKSSDIILVDGKPLHAPEPTRLFMFHKPRGTVTTDRDPEGRTTIFEVLPEGLPRVVTIGRLDINTEGLLLLTNDGGLARVLELPKTGWLRRYRVRAHGEITQPELDKLRAGVTIDGVHYAGIEAVLDRAQGSNMWLTMGLREGKNREIKRVLEHLGLSVNRLIRLSFGPFQLQDLEEGAVEEIKPRIVQDQLGEALIAEAGCLFSDGSETVAPRQEPVRRKFKPEQDFSGEAVEPQRRRHVKTMRAQREIQAAKGPRVKRKAETTRDNRGREVPVERLVRAKPDEQRRPRSTSRPARDDAAQALKTRRFEERGERQERSSSARPPRGERAERPHRAEYRNSGERKSFGDKPRFDKPFDKAAGGKRAMRPRDEGYEERPRTGRDFDKRQLSARGFKERSEARGAKPGARFDADKPRFAGERNEKPRFTGERSEKPRFEGEKPGFKPRGRKNSPLRAPTGKPPTGKPSSGKPSGAKPPRGR